MGKFSFSKLLNIIDRIECEEVKPLFDEKKCCECKEKKAKNKYSFKDKKEVR